MQRTWLIAVVLAVLLVGGVVVYLRVAEEGSEPAVEPPPAEEEPEPEMPGTAMPPADVPPLEGSDPFVRGLLNDLSSHPQLGPVLGAEDLIRKFVATVENIANGNNPRPHLRFLAPEGSFQVVRRDGRLAVDPASYRRYDAVADLVASLDARTVALQYRRLYPLLEEAYRELGHPEGGFDSALREAIDRLLSTSVPAEPPLVEERVLRYVYVDPELESRSPAAKQLMRMGPRNAGRIQGKLQEIRELLGAPR